MSLLMIIYRTYLYSLLTVAKPTPPLSNHSFPLTQHHSLLLIPSPNLTLSTSQPASPQSSPPSPVPRSLWNLQRPEPGILSLSTELFHRGFMSSTEAIFILQLCSMHALIIFILINWIKKCEMINVLHLNIFSLLFSQNGRTNSAKKCCWTSLRKDYGRSEF